MALFLVACTTISPDRTAETTLTYREFTACFSSEDLATRTSLNGTNVLWDASGEQITMVDSNGNCYTLDQTSVSSDRASATFSGNVPGSGLLYAIYPAQNSVTLRNGSVSFNVPAVQTAVENSFASATAPAISKVPGDGSLSFKNVCAIIGFTVNADDIKSIKFSASESNNGSLTGSSLVSLSDTAPVSSTFSGDGSVELTGNIASGKKYWAIVAPGEYSNLIVSFTNSQGRTATFNSSKTLVLERSKAQNVTPFTIKDTDWDDYVEPGDDYFHLVTASSSLTVGDEVLIVYISGSKALGSSAGNFRNPASVSITGETIIKDSGDASILTLENGIQSNTWAFKDGNYYLSSVSSENNYLQNSSSKTSNSSWSISINSSGVATIKAQAGPRPYIKYNSSSPRFSCYSSGQQDVAIFSRKPSHGSGLSVQVTTGSASSITTTGATISGSWSNANATVREAGFQIGTSANILDEVYQADITSASSGTFSVDLSLLNPNVTYYYRAYIILQDGSDMQEFRGSVSSFTTEEQPDVPPAGSQPGWSELPLMNISTITQGGKQFMINSTDNSQYYAWHICPDFYGPGGKLARNYTVCYSANYHCPVWVAAPRHASYENGSGRSESYKADPDIPSSIQYKSKSVGTSGCNKGHMLGSAERTCTDNTNAQVFYYSNIAPQLSSGFNTGSGGWNLLEDKVDSYVCSDTLYVVIGCYFDTFTDGYGKTAYPKTISYCDRDDVAQPTMFYYVLLRTKSGNSGKSVKNCSTSELQCAAFVRTHTNSLKGQKVTSKEMMSVSALEQITGVSYFSNVPNAPKSSYSASDWGL